jgi:hypothetical protein
MMDRMHGLTWISLVAAICTLAKAQEVSPQTTFTLASLDRSCGRTGKNCRAAFQQTFRAIAASGGGTLLLPAGTFALDDSEIPTDSRSAQPLRASSLLLVPPRTTIRGHEAADGTPDTIIEWSVTSVPVFVLFNSSFSGMSNLHLRFTGVTPSHYPYGDIDLLKALGYQPTFPHQNQMSGGDSEMSSVVYLVDSEHCKFSNLIFDSQTRDNAHIIGFAVSGKGKKVVVQGGEGGLAELANDNQFTHIRLYDYAMGFVFAGQENLRLTDVGADRRGSIKTPGGPGPGHLIYVAPQYIHRSRGNDTSFFNKNVEISNVVEGPNTYNNVNSLGTLAIKYVDGGLIHHVRSHHPAGLLQTLWSDQNVTFQDMVWESDSHFCENAPPDICSVPVINSSINLPTEPPSTNLTFEDIYLKSTYEPISAVLIGNHVVVNGLTIETPARFKEGQVNSYAALSVKNATDVAVSNYRYIPRLTAFDPREQRYNSPFTCWIPCRGVTASVEVCWPDSVPLPPANHRIVASSAQDQDKDPNNHLSISTRIAHCQGPVHIPN